MIQLDPKSVRIRVADRDFEIREYPMRENAQFILDLNSATRVVLEQTNGVADQEATFDALASQVEPLLERILRHPLDGQGPATPEFIASLTLSQRRTLLTTQAEVNGLQSDELVEKVLAVVRLALAWKTASLLPASEDPAAPTPTEVGQTWWARFCQAVQGWRKPVEPSRS